jgi:putative membrane protein
MVIRKRLSADEQQRVNAAVAEAERRSSAEFALVMVPVSDRYWPYPLVSAAVLALIVTGAVALLRPDFGIGMGFAIDALVFIGLSLVLDWLPLRLLLVPRRVKHGRAQHMAHRAFAARILARARGRNGILFFVSEGERYVELIADRDIHERVAQAAWDKIVADFIAERRAGRLAAGLIGASEACGALLAEHYPRG